LSTQTQRENSTDGTAAGAPSTDAADPMSFGASQINMTYNGTFTLNGDFHADLGASVCVDNVDRIRYSRTASGATVLELSAWTWLIFERGRIVLQEGASGTLMEREGQLTFDSNGPVAVELLGTYQCRGSVLPFAWAQPPSP